MQPDELTLLLDGADRWFAEHQPMTERVAHFRDGHPVAPGAWHAMAELGWLALTLGEEDGGIGAGQAEAFALLKRAGGDARPEPLALHLLLAPRVAGAAPVLVDGLADGRVRLALADRAPATDPLRADERADGTLCLHGNAGPMWGSDGATHVLLPVLHGGILRTALVELSAFGLGATPARLIDGRRTLLLRCTDTPATWLNLDGQVTLDLAAAGLVADSHGVLEAAFWLTLDHLKQRTQFGRPLASNQAIQHAMAEVFCDLQQLAALAGRLAAELDNTPAGPWPTLAPAKAFLGRRALRALGKLVQLSGGIAVTEDYRLTHWYRRLHVAATLFGDAEQQLSRIDVPSQLLAA